MSYARGTDWKNLFVAQDDYWVETGRSARGKKTGQQRNARENHGNDDEGHRVTRADTVKQRRQHAGAAQRASEPKRQPNPRQAKTGAENVGQDIGLGGAEGHTDANVARALSHYVGQHSVDSDGRKDKCDGCKKSKQKGIEMRGFQSACNFLLHSREPVNRHPRRDGSYGGP